ncbi:MAG: glycosyltransferase family 4 protein [Bacteroidia bacterium]|nr:glycosyltransferase family 4 protein [Bacteroidia bacterium]
MIIWSGFPVKVILLFSHPPIPLKNRLIYIFPISISFIRNDRVLLEKHFEIIPFSFQPVVKFLTPFVLVHQFFFLLCNIRKTDALVCWFAGYHSYFPSLIGKWFKKPVLIIAGGADCVNFPGIHYGNFQNAGMRAFTRASYRKVSHIAPVHEWLIQNHYTYDPQVPSGQGYELVYPGATTAHTVIKFGYDGDKFKPCGERQPNSFLTVSQMNASNFYRKGIDLYFSMARKFPHCTFTLVGNKEGMNYPGLPENVKILPFVEYDKLPEVYSSHEFYYQVSMCEGFPSAPCEAMLCGCIPIVSNVAALPEIAGDTGFILTHRDEQELEKLFHKALASDKISLSKKARERILHLYPPSERQKLITLIKDLIRI